MRTIAPIAHIRTDFPQKFGIPRQSGLVKGVLGTIVFQPECANPDAIRGIEGFSHLWLIWGFQGTQREAFSPTVRPPRLGGSTRMGVFATRSPFRPNGLGLSSVRLVKAQVVDGCAQLVVEGADLKDGTPIYDIKPYLAFTDSHPAATGGFTDTQGATWEEPLTVEISEDLLASVPEEKRQALTGVLAHDPRPAHEHDHAKVYKLAFGPVDVEFTVEEATRTLTVHTVRPRQS